MFGAIKMSVYITIKESVLSELKYVRDKTGAAPIKMKLRCYDEFVWEEIEGTDDYRQIPNEKCVKITWTLNDGDIETFLNNNDGNTHFDSSFGTQELFGVIWYDDGSWSERAEYDGSEWWAYKTCPDFDEFEPNDD